MLHKSDLSLRRSGAECDGLGAQYFWKLAGQHGGPSVASFTVTGQISLSVLCQVVKDYRAKKRHVRFRSVFKV